MESILYLVGGSFVIFLLYKFAKQIFFKLLITLLIIGVGIFSLYYFKIGPFNKNIVHIEELEKKYCAKENDPTCECIIKPLQADIRKRFSSSEIMEMKEDRIQCAYVFQKSLNEISTESKACLDSKGQKELWSTFIKQTLQLDNALVSKIEELFNEGKTSLDDQIEKTKTSKEELDNRY
jgi:hypothetical protein